MVWQFPSRIHPHERAVAPRPGAIGDLRERFYADYLKNDNKSKTNVWRITVDFFNHAFSLLW